MTPGARRVAIRAAFGVCAVALAIGTHWPSLTLPEPGGFARFDLVLHGGAFLIWTSLLIASAFFGRTFSAQNILACAMVGTTYAALDELTQMFPGLNRHAGFDDWLMDLVGVALACVGAAMLGALSRARLPAAARSSGAPASSHEQEHRGFFAAVRVVSSLTLVSRVAGLFRDMATARVFGDTAVGSAFNFAFLIPNLFRRLFGEGALSAAFIPVYAELDREGRDASARFASITVVVLTLVTTVLMAIGAAIILVILALAPGDDERTLTLRLTILLLPYMPLVCVAALLGGMLQVHNRFAPAAASSIILNVVVIAGAIAAAFLPGTDAPTDAYIVGGAAVFSGLVQVLWCLVALRPYVRWTRIWTGSGQAGRRLMKRFVPGALGLGALQLNTMIDGVIATWPILVGPTIFGLVYPLDESSGAVLGYTQRLYQFPLGVFGIAVATAVFPALSRAAGDPSLFVGIVRRGVRLSLFIGLPASVGLMIVRRDLCSVIFEGGDFSAEGVDRAALVLLGYAGAVWAYSVNHTLIRAFYAQGDLRTPLRISLTTVGLNFLGNVILIWPLGEAGLAWSTAITACLQTALLTHALRRKLPDRRVLAPEDRLGALRCLGASLAMALPVLAVVLALPIGETWTGRFVRLIAALFVGVAAYGGAAIALRIPELRWLLSRSRPSEGASPPSEPS